MRVSEWQTQWRGVNTNSRSWEELAMKEVFRQRREATRQEVKAPSRYLTQNTQLQNGSASDRFQLTTR